MSPRVVALLLAVLAAATLGGWAWPNRARLEAVRRETELVRQQADRSARRASVRRPPAGAAASPATVSESVRHARRQALALLEGRPLTGVKLEVAESRPPARCDLRLSADGEFRELARLAGDFAAAPGLALSAVRLTPRGEASHLDLEARAW